MVSIKGETVIGRRPETVFDFVADERNEPRFNPHMLRAVKLSDGPVGKGTRYRATMKSLGRTFDMLTELTEYERPTRLSSRTEMSSADIHGTLTFEPDPAGTRMRWAWEMEPKGLSRLAGPLIAAVGHRQEAAIWDGLKQHLEAAQPGA